MGIKRMHVLIGFVLCLVLSPLSVLHAANGVEAKFGWRMQDRVELGWEMWNPQTNTYDAGYLYPDGWDVELNGCLSTGGSSGIATFHWAIAPLGATGFPLSEAEDTIGATDETREPSAGLGGLSTAEETGEVIEVPVATPTPFGAQPELDQSQVFVDPSDSCARVHTFPKQGRYIVTLTVQARNGEPSTQSQVIEVKDLLIAVVGDSSASGEGNPSVRGHYNIDPGVWSIPVPGPNIELIEKGEPEVESVIEPVEWRDRRCHRSEFSGQARAAALIEQLDPHVAVTLISFACSGSEIDALTSGYMGKETDHLQNPQALPPQIEAIADLVCASSNGCRSNPRSIDALIVTVGVNDIGFETIITTCAKDPVPLGLSCDVGLTVAQALVDGIPAKYNNLVSTIQDEVVGRGIPVGGIYMTEYPDDPFSRFGGDRSGCNYMMLINHSEASRMHVLAQALNSHIRDLVSREKPPGHPEWHVVDRIPEAFALNGYCADQSYWISVIQSYNVQGDRNGTLHPNWWGHRVYEREITRVLLDELGRSDLTEPAFEVAVTLNSIEVVDTSTAPPDEYVLPITFEVNEDRLSLPSWAFVPNITTPINTSFVARVNEGGTVRIALESRFPFEIAQNLEVPQGVGLDFLSQFGEITWARVIPERVSIGEDGQLRLDSWSLRNPGTDNFTDPGGLWAPVVVSTGDTGEEVWTSPNDASFLIVNPAELESNVTDGAIRVQPPVNPPEIIIEIYDGLRLFGEGTHTFTTANGSLDTKFIRATVTITVEDIRE